METISNIASTATTTVSNLIYGDQTKSNEPAGKEPVSGKEGKGTATEPYDQGNAPTPLATDDSKTFLDYSKTGKEGEDATTSTSQNEFLQLSPEVNPVKSGTQAPATTKDETTSTGLPILPLTPDTAISGPQTSSTIDTAEKTSPTGVTDKVWKDTPLDDISRSGAPGAGPAAPEPITVATPETSDKTTTTTSTSTSDPIAKAAAPDSVTAASDIYKDSAPKDSTTTSGIVGEKPHHKSEPTIPSSSSEEKTGKMSHLKEKLKDKLHIGSKDK